MKPTAIVPHILHVNISFKCIRSFWKNRPPTFSSKAANPLKLIVQPDRNLQAKKLDYKIIIFRLYLAQFSNWSSFLPFRCVFKDTRKHVLAEGLSSQKSIATTIRDQLMSSNHRVTRKDQTLCGHHYNFPFMI